MMSERRDITDAIREGEYRKGLERARINDDGGNDMAFSLAPRPVLKKRHIEKMTCF